MEREHCSRPDADILFDTSNGIRTTSRDEYEFVVSPIRGKAYPERATLRPTPSKCRRPLSLDELWAAVTPRNAALRDLREPELIREEVVGGRLYSGPMYEKYNAVLRAESGNAFLVQRCEALTRGKRLVTQMCDALRDELHYDHQNDAAWEALAVLRRGTDGWCGHDASFSTLDVHLNAASGHDALFYNDDQAWGDAIASSVAASQRVQAWPSALARVAALTRHDAQGLLEAAQLVLNFKGCGLPEAEVVGVLLRASSKLHTLTLFDGAPRRDGAAGHGHGHGGGHGGGGGEVASHWPEAVAALASGLRGGGAALTTLNFRHFHLGRDGGVVAASLAVNTEYISGSLAYTLRISA